MIQTLEPSKRFNYTYEDSLNGAKERAFALQQSCEHDLDRLEALFGEKGAFGPHNQITVEVSNILSFGWNGGFGEDGTTLVKTRPFTGVVSAVAADEAARCVVVAELAEVLMGVRNKRRKATSWKSNGSNGEGLSIVCAAALYPVPYYTSSLSFGPRIGTWLNDPQRPDWVSATKDSDTDWPSFGCAAAFIWWLVSQLGYSLADVIQHGGATLADTFHNLTGRDTGWVEFTDILRKFYPVPVGGPGSYAPASDDLFPLYDDDQRQVTVVLHRVDLTPPRTESGGFVHVQPGPLCPAADYTYNWRTFDRALDCSVQLYGFAAPVVQYTVNGILVPAAGGVVTITAEVDTDRPDHPGQPDHSLETVTLHAEQLSGLTQRLRIDGHQGRVHLEVGARITERYNAAVRAAAASTADVVTTRGVRYDARFEADAAKCAKKLADVIHRYVRATDIDILLTLPDPAPQLRAAARRIERIRALIAEVAEHDPRAAAAAATAAARALGVDPAVVGAHRARVG
ncbi:hypothetical protein Dvina_23590 [Dactylosporangium vinaceum]|uniref:Uncharacterized protein n=1 Tax=Dactylosporangium vinaceum TaxID=53362 RepID=A0ABV5MCY3_9ACTN|nr:hypothetical protein [Dactylosporangium vinaceum]UAC00768.1 hypothetical protein Dvina_23590 [Dactylosporangium vinaceum]